MNDTFASDVVQMLEGNYEQVYQQGINEGINQVLSKLDAMKFAVHQFSQLELATVRRVYNILDGKFQAREYDF